MLSHKGFLETGASGVQRMTADQISSVQRAVAAAFSRVIAGATNYGPWMADALAFAAKVAADVLRAYPVDRSCITCDFYVEGHCRSWDQTVPPAHRERGCDRHQTHGAPF